LAACFDKPVKPDLPPEILSVLPGSNSVYDEGMPVDFELRARDDRFVEQIRLIVDEQVTGVSAADTFHLRYPTTRKEGKHYFHYQIQDSKGQIRQTTPWVFTVQPFSFQIQSPDIGYYIADSLRFKLASTQFDYCRWIRMSYLETIMLMEPWSRPDFALDLSGLNPGLYSVKLGLLDQDSLDLEEHDYSFIKVSGPVLQMPDTTFSASDSIYYLPLEIRRASDLYLLDFKIEYYNDYIRIMKIEMTEPARSRKLSFSTTSLSSPDQMAVFYQTIPTDLLNGNSALFMLELKRGAKAQSGLSTTLIFSSAQGNGGMVTLYGNKCKINFE